MEAGSTAPVRAGTRRRTEAAQPGNGRDGLLEIIAESPDWVIQADGGLRLVYLNPAAQAAFAAAGDAAPVHRLPDLFEPAVHDELACMLDIARRQRVFVGESRMVAADAMVPVSLVLIAHPGVDGGTARYSVVARDLSERAGLERRLAHHATHDALTGLPNRVALVRRIDEAIGLAGRNGRLAAVMFIDFDDFKRVNDSFGHSAGDELLAVCARRLQTALRQGDMLARFGGDEFVVVAQDLNGERDAAAVARKLLLALDAPVPLGGGRQVPAHASIGICLVPRDAVHAEAALGHADQAMYRAKREGRGYYCFHAAGQEPAAEVSPAAALKEALHGADGRLSLHYQPQVSVPQGRIIGIECLVRWAHPLFGGVGPGRFVPPAGESGLILALGDWVLRAACRQAAQWRQAGFGMPLAVKASPHELRQAGFAERVGALLAHHGLPPDALEVEITETALMGGLDEVVGNLDGLRRVGVRIALDDFGSGHASLAHVRTLPLDRLRIGRGFVDGVGVSGGNRAVVEAILTLGRRLGLEVMAEGVEHVRDLEVLMELGCSQIQGRLFHPVLSAGECFAVLSEERAVHDNRP
ncbi:putative bifunctional diguanylate cyclase/phosphodiesterase [Pseudothauera rhizosphaerae]|uniref:putative bifunctional diguanylate cyclase/phosphodiesterase n=1 Tax=Pseudothauera rhizosphaerae TaxID=2565932 RepID=UPI001454C362|nr:EAL domain-containing protein [Pseudothauera rhizosphaerae]